MLHTAILLRVQAAVLSIALISATLIVGVGALSASAVDNIQLSATSQTSVLAGESPTITLTAHNASGSTNEYNLSYRYALPAGATYAPDSTTPVPTDEPTIFTIVDTPANATTGAAAVTHQVLVWSNVSDLLIGDTRTLTFGVDLDSDVSKPAVFPVGASLTGTAAEVFANGNPRTLPKFDSTTGSSTGGSYTAYGTVTPPTTAISAIKISKSEPSPETELMRGVHNQTTVYTLTVQNTTKSATSDVVVVDDIPAQLEFLGCGGTDNSVVHSPEYTGAPALTATANPGSNCLAPSSVATINGTGTLSGVFTEVTWKVGSMNPGVTISITYAAGIPLLANTMTWDGSAGTPAVSGAQASNLDNNNGASTRQMASGSSLINTATATGTYTGTLAPTTSTAVVTSSTHYTNKIMDLSIVKTTTTPSFDTGKAADFALTLRSSEYVDDSAMTVVDTIPNGMCPLVPDISAVYSADAGANPLPGDCSTAGVVSNATVKSVEAKSDGSYVMTLIPTLSRGTLAHDGRLVIGYSAFMLTNYQDGARVPTAAGDSFANTVVIDGTSTSITDPTPTAVAVHDDSKVTLGSAVPTIQKLVLPRPTAAGPVDCAASDGQYIDNHLYPKSGVLPVYQLGDRICFELRVNFSTTVATKNPQIQDFVPTGTTYENYSVSPTSGVAASDVVESTPSGADAPVFTIGKTQNGAQFVDKAETLTMFVSAIVSSTSTHPVPDITANLMKYRQETTAGGVLSLRYAADYGIAAPILPRLVKTVIARSPDNTISDPKNALVGEGDTATFGLDVINPGTAAAGNDQTIENIALWDQLPAGLDCADNYVPSTNGGTCTDVTTNGVTTGTIGWNIAGPIAAGSHSSVSYVLQLPKQLSESQTFTNRGSVVAFDSATTAGAEQHYFPLRSLDTSHAVDGNTPQVDDTAAVHTASVALAKSGTPNITEKYKSATQVVAGETIDYTYSAAIPAHTSVYNAVLSDGLPASLSIPAAATFTVMIDGTGYDPSSLPAGYSLDGNGALTFPTDVDNTTANSILVSVTIHGALVGVGLTVHDPAIVNTATFTSTSLAPATSSPVVTPPATFTVNVVSPVPTLTKSVSPAIAAGGDVVTYTITASGAPNKPASFDPVVTDCLPAGLIFDSFVSPSASTDTKEMPGTGDSATNGCATTATFIQWNLPASTILISGTNTVLTFTATVEKQAVGKFQYPNTARLISSTLMNGSNDPTVEGVITTHSTTDATVTVQGATLVKTIIAPVVPHVIGSDVKYQLSVTLPAKVNFFNASVIDTLPTPAGSLVIDPSVPSTFSCTADHTPDPSTDCASDVFGNNGNHDLAASGSPATMIGYYLGDVTEEPYVRTVVITFSATIADLSTTNRGTVLSNSATVKWNYAEAIAVPTAANATFDATAVKSTVLFTVVCPLVTVQHLVETLPAITTQPGTNFTYTVVPTNDNDVNAAISYDTVVKTIIPTGVVVDASTITGSGVPTYTGGVITSISWPAGTLAVNSSGPALKFVGVLADSATLTTAVLKSDATADSYRSLEQAGRISPASAVSIAAVTPIFPAVTVAKSAPSHVAYIGTPLPFTLTYTNGGLGTAQTISASDLLPANWVLVGTPTLSIAGGAPANFAPSSSAIGSTGVQTLQWPATGTPLAPGQTAVIVYQAEPTTGVLPKIGSSVAQINTASAVTTDPSGASRNSTADYTGNPAQFSTHIDQADISITKSAGHALIAGTTTADAWILTVANNGDTGGSDAAVGPFTVTDTPTLPTGVTIDSVSGPGWTCSTPDPTTGQFTCTRPDGIAAVAAGATATFATPGPITIAVKVAATVASGVQVPNSATVADQTWDLTPANNTDSKTLTVATSADLLVTKSANGVFTAGGSASWALNVTNLGPSIARWPLTVVDTLPTTGIDASKATASGTDWTCGAPTTGANPTITCTYSGPTNTTDLGLGLGSTPAITVTAPILSATTTAITNSASVSSPTTDPVTSNNTTTVTTPVDTTTSLTITKEIVSPQPLIAGTPVTYEFTVTNNETPDARSVVITDPLPDGLVYVSSTPVAGGGTWTCSDVGTPSASSVRCTLAGTLGGSVSGHDVAKLRITVSTPSSLTGGVLNTATVAWTTGTSQGQDNGTTTSEADLRMIKSHQTGAIYAGTDVTYSLSVQNLAGESDEPIGATVVDTLPTGLSYGAVTPAAGWNCAAPENQLLTCTSTAIIVTGTISAVATVVAHVPSTSGATTYTNLADVSGVINDPQPTNNHAADPTIVTDSAVVSLKKTVAGNATTWIAGTNITYSLVVTNAGPSAATALTVSDTLPAGLSLVSITSADTAWTCSTTTASCTRPMMDVGSSTITVVAHVSSAVPNGTVETNDSSAQWTDSRGTPNTVLSNAAVTIIASADLTVVKTPATQNAIAGNTVTFALAASNLGSSDAVGPVTITDTLPVGLRYVSSSASWTCVAATTATTAPQDVVCTLGSAASQPGLAAGVSAPILTMVTVSDPALGAVTLTNTAVVSSPTADPVTSNNTGTATVTLSLSADLGITKTHIGHGIIGSLTDFTIVVTNAAGPSVARVVTVVDTLPRGLTYVGFAGSDALWSSCAAAATDAVTGTTAVTCVYAATAVLAPGTSTTLHLQALVAAPAYASVDNAAAVSSSTPDPNTGNNTATDTLVVDPLVELNVLKTHVGQLVSGQNGQYLITVTNGGPTEDPGGFSVTDTLPAGLDYVSISGAGVDCTLSGSTVTCTFAGALAVNETRSVTLTVAVGQQAYPTVTNTATVASLWPELPTATLSSTDVARVAPEVLPFTGSTVNVISSALIVGALFLLGFLLLMVARRRKRVQ